jgi:manganese/zinc/iron transport system permease protein
MTQPQIEIQLTAAIVAAACALPGAFLVLRRMAMMSDAISHTVLLGIVLAFFIVGELGHPLLMLGAAAVGVLTVSLTELLNKTRLVKEDAAIGLVFPALFSLAIILISVYARNVHLDQHTVFQGDLAFVPFERAIVMGIDFGPRTLVIMSLILLLNLVLIALFYKELKLATFDAGLAAALGFSPALIHYGLMTMVSVTAVGAFDAVGSILVIALMIVPPATAYLLTDSLPRLLGLSVLLGIIGGISGYWLARALDTNIGGAMVMMLGILFGLVFLFSPQRGLAALARQRQQQKWQFAETMLTIHLLNHEGQPEFAEESRVDHLIYHLRWSPEFATKLVQRAVMDELVIRQNGHLLLTEQGRRLANTAVTR